MDPTNSTATATATSSQAAAQASHQSAASEIQLNPVSMPRAKAPLGGSSARYDSIQVPSAAEAAAGEAEVEENDDGHHKSDLNVWQGAALLTADCLGTGILALPQDIAVLGVPAGVSFLVLNMFVNMYAGTILSRTADHLEDRGIAARARRRQHESVPTIEEDEQATAAAGDDNDGIMQKSPVNGGLEATHDFATMAAALFAPNAARPYLDVTRWVLALFYVNIFLVLGDYILVMSHAVAALAGDVGVCLPQAGLLASTLMFAIAQLKSMASLGRSVSIISLLCLAIVIVQCIYHHRTLDEDDGQHVAYTDQGIDQGNTNYTTIITEPFVDDQTPSVTMWQKLSALGSIGFAMGSQKLLLNIRHELADRAAAPKSLGISLTSFTTAYIGVVAAAGRNPPGFLFDAIPHGWNRRLAGLFLWVHVAVSYAINSQALCASIERTFVGRSSSRLRWLGLTGVLAACAFFVANAVPFFKDLVALIGALTSVPLTLLLPALYFRQLSKTKASLALLLFAVAFMILALAGSIDSIGLDWEHQTGGFFSCIRQ